MRRRFRAEGERDGPPSPAPVRGSQAPEGSGLRGGKDPESGARLRARSPGSALPNVANPALGRRARRASLSTARTRRTAAKPTAMPGGTGTVKPPSMLSPEADRPPAVALPPRVIPNPRWKRPGLSASGRAGGCHVPTIFKIPGSITSGEGSPRGLWCLVPGSSYTSSRGDTTPERET